MSVQSERIKRLMQSVSYKPGWKMTVIDLPYSIYSPWRPSYKVMLIYTVQDAAHPDRLTSMSYEREWHEQDTDRAPDSFVVEIVIMHMLRQAEQNEFEKWFRFNGQPFNRETIDATNNPPRTTADSQLPRINQEVR